MNDYIKLYRELMLESIDFNDPCLLFRLSGPNEKIDHHSFSLRSGWTCPFAKKCLAKAVEDPITKKRTISRGPDADMQCFSASQEALYPEVYNQRDYNEKLAKVRLAKGTSAFAKTMIKSISENIPRSQTYFRIHVGGDFFNKDYLQGWLLVVKAFPDITFYAYTKSYPYFENLTLPPNFIVTHSLGGRYDNEIKKKGLKFAAIVYSEDEAKNYPWTDKSGQTHVGLEIDHDDSHAYSGDKPFALLIHGSQPAGSDASKAVVALKKKAKELNAQGLSAHGIGGYRPGEKTKRLPTGPLPDDL